jgi:hypothetical protein
MIESKLVLGIDLTRGGNQDFTSQVETMVLRLIEDNELRERLSLESTNYFDGLGKVRVINYLEKIINNEA